tara:strand:+ start:588 stop:1382 length:795 start_codon:yes stop_codon:yes gene_type:complete
VSQKYLKKSKTLYMKKKILIVIPFYNEKSSIRKILPLLNDYFKIYNFIFINDNSTDGSEKILKNKKIIILNNKKRMGIGYGLKKGLKYAIKKKYDLCIYMSANGKMKLKDIKKFTTPLLKKKNPYNYVNGSRFLNYNKNSNTPIFRYYSIKIISLILSFIYRREITDFSCGFRGFNTKFFHKFANLPDTNLFNTYGFEYYLYSKVILSHLKSKEVPISMWYPKKKNVKYSKIRPIVDWVKIIFPWIIAYFDGIKPFENYDLPRN